MKKYVFLCLGVLCTGSAIAQKEAWNWFLGDSAGIQWVNGKTPVSVDWYKLRGEEGTGSISDSAGNLLFYTDGIDIYDAKNEKLNKDFSLNGDWSSTEGKLILKHPESNVYHVFTNKYLGLHKSFLYHTSFFIMDDSAIFIDKATILKNLVSEGIGAVNHQNQRDIILITHSLYGDSFLFNILTNTGISECTKIVRSGDSIPTISSRNTTFSIAPSGKYISFSTETVSFPINNYKLNNQTLRLNDRIQMSTTGYFPWIFSPNDSFIYCDPNNYSVAQYPIYYWIKDSIFKYGKTIYNDPNFRSSCLRNAPGGKLLIARDKQNFVSIINDANKPSPQCDFVNKAVTLVQGKCRFGNYNTNQSYFYTPSVNFKYKQNCDSNAFNFNGIDTFGATDHFWKIEKGNSKFSYTTQNSRHTFSDTGVWKVKYIASNGGRKDSISKEIEIFQVYKPGFMGKDIGYCGNAFPFDISAPQGMNCYTWKTPKGKTIEYLDKISVDTIGNYTVQMCNPAFCYYYDTIAVYETSSPDAPKITRKGDSLFVTNVQPGVGYQWFRGNTFTGKTGIAIKLTDTGFYKARAFVPVNCYSSWDSIQIAALNTSKSTSQEDIEIFPNPAFTEFYLQNVPIGTIVKIYTVQGVEVMYKTITTQNTTVQVGQLHSGIYIISLAWQDKYLFKRLEKI